MRCNFDHLRYSNNIDININLANFNLSKFSIVLIITLHSNTSFYGQFVSVSVLRRDPITVYGKLLLLILCNKMGFIPEMETSCGHIKVFTR